MPIRALCVVLLLSLLSMLAFADNAPAKLGPPTPDEVKATQAQGRYLATITMENGKTFELVLEGGYMPYTVANFVKLANAKFYDGLDFFLAESQPSPGGGEVGFVSGGDPSGAGAGYGLALEISPYLLRQQRGAVSMFRRQALDSSCSQFIIMRSELTAFDGRLALFAWVKSGMDEVDNIREGDKMKTVVVAPYAGTEACPLLFTPKKAPANLPPTKDEVEAVRKQGRYLATITLENGKKIVMVLEGKDAPIAVANYIKLAQAKFYDGLTFHRVEDKTGMQLIQGGDPQGNGRGDPGYEIRFEKSNLLHKAGALGMARSQDPNSAGCQFYIVRCDIPNLDHRYVVFGWVKEGMEAVAGVRKGDTMKSVTVVPYNGADACPLLPAAK